MRFTILSEVAEPLTSARPAARKAYADVFTAIPIGTCCGTRPLQSALRAGRGVWQDAIEVISNASFRGWTRLRRTLRSGVGGGSSTSQSRVHLDILSAPRPESGVFVNLPK